MQMGSERSKQRAQSDDELQGGSSCAHFHDGFVRVVPAMRLLLMRLRALCRCTAQEAAALSATADARPPQPHLIVPPTRGAPMSAFQCPFFCAHFCSPACRSCTRASACLKRALDTCSGDRKVGSHLALTHIVAPRTWLGAREKSEGRIGLLPSGTQRLLAALHTLRDGARFSSARATE